MTSIGLSYRSMKRKGRETSKEVGSEMPRIKMKKFSSCVGLMTCCGSPRTKNTGSGIHILNDDFFFAMKPYGCSLGCTKPIFSLCSH